MTRTALRRARPAQPSAQGAALSLLPGQPPIVHRVSERHFDPPQGTVPACAGNSSKELGGAFQPTSSFVRAASAKSPGVALVRAGPVSDVPVAVVRTWRRRDAPTGWLPAATRFPIGHHRSATGSQSSAWPPEHSPGASSGASSSHFHDRVRPSNIVPRFSLGTRTSRISVHIRLIGTQGLSFCVYRLWPRDRSGAEALSRAPPL